jgi:uncharacterized protein (DUF58 family)
MTDIDIAQLHKKVRRIEIVSKRLVEQRVAGEYHSVFKGQGIEFEEVRPYAPGDEIRSIDWNVTARAGAPHIKRYREEREMSVFFIVDMSGSCRFGTRGEFKSERMAEITAVLALAAIANNDRVGLLLVTDRIEKVVPPRKGRRHVLRLAREVLGFVPQGRGTDLALGLDHLRHVLPHRAVVFLLSDLLADGFERALAMVARRHDLVVVSVLDPAEQALPDAGLLDLLDGETGQRMVVDAGNPRVRAWHAERMRQARQARIQLCRRHEVDMIELETDRPYESELVKFFKRRARRMARQ